MPCLHHATPHSLHPTLFLHCSWSLNQTPTAPWSLTAFLSHAFFCVWLTYVCNWWNVCLRLRSMCLSAVMNPRMAWVIDYWILWLIICHLHRSFSLQADAVWRINGEGDIEEYLWDTAREIKSYTRFQHDYSYIALYEVIMLSFLKMVLHHLG